MFFTEALAQTATGAAPAGGAAVAANLIPLVLIFVVFYFLLIRPQQKKIREHHNLINNVRRGDKIITGGGVYGTVVKVDNDDTLQVEIAPNVKVRIAKGSIGSIVTPTSTSSAEKTPDAPAKVANDN